MDLVNIDCSKFANDISNGIIDAATNINRLSCNIPAINVDINIYSNSCIVNVSFRFQLFGFSLLVYWFLLFLCSVFVCCTKHSTSTTCLIARKHLW